MRARHSLTILCLPIVVSIAALADRPVNRVEMFAMEKQFEQQTYGLWADDRFMFQQLPRAYYVPNFGVLLTAELSVAPGPAISPFRGPITNQEIVTHKRLIVLRVPKLRDFLRSQLLNSPAFFPSLADADRLGIAVTIYHMSWEDIEDVPTQIVVQGTKKALVAARSDASLREQAIEMKDSF